MSKASTTLVILVALKILLHTLTNNQYGFHRDELATLDDARHLAWGYVAYPPVTPFLGRISLELLGTSLRGFRFFAVLAGAAAVFITGLMARELGGKRFAQGVAAAAVATAPLSLASSRVMQYVAFDYLAWVLLAYAVVRLLNTDDSRWWVAIGAVIGFGMLTKYTMIFFVAGVVIGVLLTATRRQLRSPWLWYGVAISLVVFLPNLVWQIQHNFISIDFLTSIHARDIRIGRTDNFLVTQLMTGAGLFTLPLAIGGLVWLLTPYGKRYRMLVCMFIVPLMLFTIAKGRNYYQAPAYPMLFAAGSVWLERFGRVVRGVTWTALAANAVLGVALLVPVAPVGSVLWKAADNVGDDFREEIGWPELVKTVAGIRDSLPSDDLAHLGVLARNYGEAGAIDLYGGAYKLPEAISGVNSYWLRGYGDPVPQTLIVVGLSKNFLEGAFDACTLAGHVTNTYGVVNEETSRHQDVFICRRLRQPWPQFWKSFRYFG